jgi:WD40 repeat protein
MGKNSFWTALAFVVIGILTFGVALAFMGPQEADRQAAPPRVPTAAKQADAPTAAAAKKAETLTPAPEAPVAKKAAPEPEPPPRPLLLKRWRMPGDAASDGKGGQDDFSIRELYFDPTGTRLVMVSPRAAHCLDIAQDKIVGTVYPDLSGDRFHYPRLVISPDGRFAAVPRKNGRDLDLYELATGRRLYSYHPGDERAHFAFDDGHVAFGPSRESLVALVDCFGPLLYAFWTKTGTGRELAVPGFRARKETAVQFLYVPEQGVLLLSHIFGNDAQVNPSGLGVLDLASCRETLLTAFSIRSCCWDRDLPMKLSPDRRLLVVKGREGTLQVCDWRTNQRLFAHEAGGEYQDPGFTPDCRYLLVLWHNVLHGTAHGIFTRQYTPSTIQLFDLARQKQVGTFIPQENDFPHAPTAVAVSPDGKTLAVASERVVGLVDFEGAFGVKPGPASPGS